MTSTRPERLTGINYRTAPDDKPFPWGPIQEIHEIGPYAIAEYRRDMSRVSTDDYSDHGGTFFQPYIRGENGKFTAAYSSARSLDEALVVAIAHRAEGPNSSAAYYFARMIGLASD